MKQRNERHYARSSSFAVMLVTAVSRSCGLDTSSFTTAARLSARDQQACDSNTTSSYVPVPFLMLFIQCPQRLLMEKEIVCNRWKDIKHQASLPLDHCLILNYAPLNPFARQESSIQMVSQRCACNLILGIADSPAFECNVNRALGIPEFFGHKRFLFLPSLFGSTPRGNLIKTYNINIWSPQNFSFLFLISLDGDRVSA